jgi:hypothetical protein
LKSVVFARAGNLSVGDHLAEMREWLTRREIVPLELSQLHILNSRVVFRARFAAVSDADQFVQTFGL